MQLYTSKSITHLNTYVTQGLTRLNVRLVNRFMEKPITCHLLVTKRILRYTKGTKNHVILMSNQKNTSKKSMAYGYSDFN